MDNGILFLQKCLLNGSLHFIRLFDWLPGQDKKFIFEKSLFLKNHKKVECNIHIYDISD